MVTRYRAARALYLVRPKVKPGNPLAFPQYFPYYQRNDGAQGLATLLSDIGKLGRAVAGSTPPRFPGPAGASDRKQNWRCHVIRPPSVTSP